MKRIPIQPIVIYQAIVKHGPIEIEDIGICSRSHTLRAISELRAAGKVYISGWRETSPGHYRMLLSAGCKVDVPMPRITHEEKLRRWRTYYNKHVRKPKAEPPPPTLPTHHPRIGVWGV